MKLHYTRKQVERWVAETMIPGECPLIWKDWLAQDAELERLREAAKAPSQVITEITPTTGRNSFDCTPQQYHARLDMLWAAIPEITATGVDDVFTLVVGRIESLTEAAAAVVDLLSPGFSDIQSRESWLSELEPAVIHLAIAAGIKAPPQDGDAGDRADEAHERKGDR